MTRYFAQNTPRAGLEHMMMSVPGFQKRGGGMMILSRFCYKPEDVDCRYCLHYRRRSCQVRTCPYIAERLKSGAIEYLDLILEYFGHIPHAGLHKRIQAVEHWSGPDQAVLHTVSVHLRSRFADRVWDDAPPGYLAALYLLASKERLWQPALPALSHDSIDFSRIVSKPHGFAIQDYPIFYSARRLYDLKSPMEAEDLAHPKLVSDLDFHNIIYATMIARYGKAVMDASMLLDMALRYHPDIICVGEMRSAEAYAAQEAARTGHGVLTTIHSNSSQATWRRMVTLCKRKHEMADDTLMDLVTEAFPIVVFAKQLEDKSRKIMEIMECEILPTGERRYNTLYHFKIEENRLEDGKYRIKGRHEAVNPISESLQKRFIDNGMPQEVLTQLVGKKSAPSKGKSGSSPAKAGQATPAPKTRSAQSKPPAKPETGKEGGESV